MKIEGTAEIITGRVVYPEPESEDKKFTREKVRITLEGSADAVLTFLQEMKAREVFRNMNLQ